MRGVPLHNERAVLATGLPPLLIRPFRAPGTGRLLAKTSGSDHLPVFPAHQGRLGAPPGSGEGNHDPLNSPAAEVVLAVMASAGKMERLAINERISAARERLAAEGRAWGRPPRLAPRERNQIRQLRRAGRTVREIAVALKIPRSTVGRVASHPSGSKDEGTTPGFDSRRLRSPQSFRLAHV